jgi:hypothetical protein
VYGHLIASDALGCGYVIPLHASLEEMATLMKAQSAQLPTDIDIFAILHDQDLQVLPYQIPEYVQSDGRNPGSQNQNSDTFLHHYVSSDDGPIWFEGQPMHPMLSRPQSPSQGQTYDRYVSSPMVIAPLSNPSQFKVTDSHHQSNYVGQEDIWDEPHNRLSSSSWPWMRPYGGQQGQPSTPPTNATEFNPDVDAVDARNLVDLSIGARLPNLDMFDYSMYDPSSIGSVPNLSAFDVPDSNVPQFEPKLEPAIDSGFVSMQTSPQRSIQPFVKGDQGDKEKSDSQEDQSTCTGQTQESEQKSVTSLLEFNDRYFGEIM